MSFIPLMRPNITEDDIKTVCEVLRSGMLVQGKHVEQLENRLIQTFQGKFASALSNGTATLHLALKVLGIGPGDEVIVPAFSFMATANVVELIGATPVFVDIDIDTFNIDPTLIEAAITTRTRAIIPVHEFGLSAEIGEIMNIAAKYSLHVIEDAACALGATENGRHVGTFGDFGSFSFHPRKAITTGEGGALLTNKPDLHKTVQILRNHGIQMKDGEIDFSDFGYNYRLTDFQAALFNSQFARLPQIIETRQKLAAIYLSELKAYPQFKLPSVPPGKNHTWQTFHILIPDYIDRGNVIEKMRSYGIGTNYGAQCMPFMNSFRRKYNLDCHRHFPNALKAYLQGLALPLYEGLTPQDIHVCVNTLIKST
ncbi:DegT/DnrJ/EryC1/StrS family aminotransferase [Chitinophaga lutea]|uniref:DegT/DnrJ/EryC1/StrS family aminotransferase n=1 Tax=Chitinophaga lutea TaxID=2488634 RepID=A0A3N4Q1Z7_9BACT|nr:DegT/DnrJ/EryC1/StrS family aminotransferase [Chitinophaga lutea]RPE13229.1 DegT/DnrJ/EryC1/StrS family aminotransferase [Chitinophaga lutea]